MMSSNSEHYAFPFHLYAALTMCQNHMKESSKPIKIMERSLLSVSKCFIELLRENETMEPVLCDILDKWLSFHLENFPIKIHHLFKNKPGVTNQKSSGERKARGGEG